MRTTLAVLAAGLTVGSTALAQEPAQVPQPTTQTLPPPTPPPAPSRIQSSGIRMHDGFYLRVGGGFGAYQERIFRKTGSDEPHTTVTGMGTASELMIGGNVSRKVVLGGGLWSMTALATDVTTVTGSPGSPQLPVGTANTPSLTILGPFLAYYFDPAEGFTMHFSLGFASSRELDPSEGRFDRDRVAVGVGGLFGIGYEWWVGEQWSMGVSWRFAGAVATQKQDGQRLTHVIGTSPIALFSVTYH